MRVKVGATIYTSEDSMLAVEFTMAELNTLKEMIDKGHRIFNAFPSGTDPQKVDRFSKPLQINVGTQLQRIIEASKNAEG